MLFGAFEIGWLVFDYSLLPNCLQPILSRGGFLGNDSDELDAFFPVDIDGLDRLPVSAVQDLSCRSNRNSWVAGMQVLDQDLGGLEPPALEDLAHFARKFRPAARIATRPFANCPLSVRFVVPFFFLF